MKKKEKLYEVEMVRVVEQRAYTEVYAENEDQARERAANFSHYWGYHSTVASPEPTSVKQITN